jgi:hypothetical protein
MAVLWSHYKSPIFPFANHVIGSPYAPETSFADVRFRPDGLAETLSYPIQFASGGEVAWEFAFRDLRLGLLYVLFLVLFARFVLSKGRRGLRPDGSRLFVLLTVFSVASYIVWQSAFCVYRYLAPLELLAPLMVVLTLVHLLSNPGRSLAASALALGLIVWTVQMPPVERLAWSEDIFSVQLPAPAISKDAVVLLAGDDATSYLVTYFPPEVRFLRIAGNFAAADEETQLHRDMARTIDSSLGPLYFLKGPYDIDHDALRHFAVAIQEGSCLPVVSRVDRNLALCTLYRL